MSSASSDPRAPSFPIFLSIVVVDRDQYDTLRAKLVEIGRTVGQLVDDFEIIVVDNGSSQEHRGRYVEITGSDGLPNVQVYHLLKSVDAEVAYWAGMENSLGDYVLAYDPYNEDLSRLPEALTLALAGHDVVMIHNERLEATGLAQRAIAGVFRRLYRRLYGVDLAIDASQHRLLSKRVVNFLLQMPLPAMQYRSLPATAGFQRATLRYDAPRQGKTDHGFRARARRAVNLLFSSPLLPLRIISMVALLGSVLNLAYSGYVLGVALLKSDVAPGWTTLSLQQSGMFFLFSIVLLVLTESMIRVAQLGMEGGSYFIIREQTSAVLTRKARLNVENARRDVA